MADVAPPPRTVRADAEVEEVARLMTDFDLTVVAVVDDQAAPAGSGHRRRRARARAAARLAAPLYAGRRVMTCEPSRTGCGCAGSAGATASLVALAFLGPGLIAANAGNDAGGIATYSSVGARYGYDLLWMMVVITVSLIVVQEMAARMGAVTGKGLADLVREQYGIRWALFATVQRAGREPRHLHLGVRRHRRGARPRAHPGADLGADRRRRGVDAARPRLVQARRADLRR